MDRESLRKKQIKFYKSLLKENEILLLKSQDSFYKNHYDLSPLNILTGFQGSEGEAIINSKGEITIFVDTRYHILVEKQVYKDIKIYKLDLGESFFSAFKKLYKKNTILHLNSDIPFEKYLLYRDYFDLRTYKLKKDFLKNGDIKEKRKIFLADKNIERHDFSFKIEKYKKLNPKISKTIVFNLDNIAYLTNLRSFKMMNSSLFPAILYLDFKNSKYILFLDKIPKKIKIDNLEFMELDSFEAFIKGIDAEIAINYSDISLEHFALIRKPKQIKKDSLSLISSIKPLSVINEMIDSSAKLDKAIFEFKNKIKIGMSEVDLVKLFEEELEKTGAKMTSFKTILALDENSASIHYSTQSKKKKVKNESLILLDCGGYWDNGYATDITRTFYFGKKPKPIYKEIYSIVLKAFINCFLSKETNAGNIDKIARDILAKYNDYGFYFNHGLGHGIGTSCHQNPPRLSIKSKDIIKPYQTHSIEPGLYGKSISDGVEFGVRIENCVYCDLDYQRFSLSKFPFEDILIDYNIFNEVEKDFIKKWQKKFESFKKLW